MKTAKKCISIISTILVSLLVLIVLLLWGVRLVGLEALVVQSGSMEPEIPVGAVVYVRKTDPAELEVGDVITFSLGNGVRGTHRIIEITEEKGQTLIYTKGDANDVTDSSPVTEDTLIGKVVFHLPYLGFLAAYIQTTSGRYAAIGAGAVVLLMLCLPELLFTNKEEKENAK